jgi:hypothetical protein
MPRTLCKLLLTAVLGTAPVGAGAFTPPAAPLGTIVGEAPLHLAQSRGEVRRDRRALREERGELRRAQRSGDARRIRRERRDVREAQRDLRDSRDFRRRYYVRDGRRYYRGPSGGEIFAGFVAGAIAGAAARNADAVAWCESRYRSYDPASGTYLGRDGRRHRCP